MGDASDIRNLLKAAAEDMRAPPDGKELRSWWRDFASSAERMSKRVTALLAVASAAGVMGSSGLAWWATHQGFGSQDREAQLTATLQKMDQKLDRIELTIGGLGPRVDTLESKVWIQNEKLASLGSWAKGKGWPGQ